MDPEAVRRGDWREFVPPSLTPVQKYWLRRPGALTVGLRAMGRVDLSVIGEYAAGLTPREARIVGHPCARPMHIREILMSIDGIDSVVARSFTPRDAAFSRWRGMRALNRRPLADMLYNDIDITRSQFFTCRLRRTHPLYRTVRRALRGDTPAAHELLARCSVFWRRGSPLMVAECFLPAFWPLAAKIGSRRHASDADARR